MYHITLHWVAVLTPSNFYLVKTLNRFFRVCVTLGFGTDSNMLGLTLPRDDPRLIARRVDLLFLMFTPTGGASRVVSVQHKTLKLSSNHDGI